MFRPRIHIGGLLSEASSLLVGVEGCRGAICACCIAASGGLATAVALDIGWLV